MKQSVLDRNAWLAGSVLRQKQKRDKTGAAWKWKSWNVALHEKTNITQQSEKKNKEKRTRICCANICFCIFQKQTTAQPQVYSDCILISSTKLTLMGSLAFCFIKLLQLHWMHLTVYNSLQAFTVEYYSTVWQKISPPLYWRLLSWCLLWVWAPQADGKDTVSPQIHLVLKSHPSKWHCSTSHRKWFTVFFCITMLFSAAVC